MLRRAHGAINLRQVPLRLREQFRALCALRGTSMTGRLVELMELDIQRAYDTGEYQPNTRFTIEEEVRAGQQRLWPDDDRGHT